MVNHWYKNDFKIENCSSSDQWRAAVDLILATKEWKTANPQKLQVKLDKTFQSLTVQEKKELTNHLVKENILGEKVSEIVEMFGPGAMVVGLKK
jgi:hypothetical protein